jgi:hypothetical protein
MQGRLRNRRGPWLVANSSTAALDRPLAKIRSVASTPASKAAVSPLATRLPVLVQGSSPADGRSHELRTSPALLLLSGRRSLSSLADSHASESPPTAGACTDPANGRPVERSKQQSRRRRRSVPHRNDRGTLIDSRARFPFVAGPGAWPWRLLLLTGAPKEKSRPAFRRRLGCLQVRERRSGAPASAASGRVAYICFKRRAVHCAWRRRSSRSSRSPRPSGA